jgi:hypothetical protein
VLALLLGGLLQLPSVAVAAQATAPVRVSTFPTDGATVTATDVTVTATYDQRVRIRALTVVDDTTGRELSCLDVYFESQDGTTVRCRVLDLPPGHTFRAYPFGASSESWQFTVSAPTITSTALDPTQPLAVTYDRALEPGTTTARLMSSVRGTRTSVAATVTITGATVTVTPSAPLPDGEYALVLDASGAARTLEVFAGSHGAVPGFAPTMLRAACCSTHPEAFQLGVPPGSTLGLVVYDPAHPDVQRRTEVTASTCESSADVSCRVAVLPVAALPAGSYAWYADARLGDVTASTADHPLVLGPPPPAPTAVSATAPQSSTDSPYVHVTAAVDPAVVGVVVQLRAHLAYVAADRGTIGAYLYVGNEPDGDLPVRLTAYDAAGQPSPLATATAPKESVPLALRSAVRPTVRYEPLSVEFSEPIRDDSTLAVLTPAGKAVPGTLEADSAARGVLSFTPRQTLPSGTYHLVVTAYARSCPPPATTTCERISTTVDQLVDITPPAAVTAIIVTPRVSSSSQSVVVSGHATAGDTLVVQVGSQRQQLGLLSTADFTSAPFDVSAAAHALLPVTLYESDPPGNLTTTRAGAVDRRFDTRQDAVTVSSRKIPWGTTTVVTGRLRTTAGTPLPGRRVQLIERDDAGHHVVLSTTGTDGVGRFRTSVVLTVGGTIASRFLGDAGERSSDSPASPHVAVGRATPPADHPGTLAAARLVPASRQGVRLSETLDGVDIFSFGVGSTGTYRVLLGHLTTGAALDVFDAASHHVATSQHAGRAFEEVFHRFAPGTYFVRVAGRASATPYHLTISRLADGAAVLSQRRTIISDFTKIDVEVYNTAATTQEFYFFATCTLRGRVTRTGTFRSAVAVAPHTRQPEWVAGLSCPAGQVLHLSPRSVAVPAQPTTYRLGIGTPYVRYFRHSHARYYPVTLTNTGTRPLPAVYVYASEYDNEGVLSYTGYTYLGPTRPRATVHNPYLWVDNSPTPNWVLFSTQF